MFLLYTTILAILLGLTSAAPWGETHRLLIVSFDGFRWNYLQRTNTPNFHKFIDGGVHARYGLKNAFVTKTFPNHFTLVTGLWEENHGIINNEMYDPLLNQSFVPWDAKAQVDPAWFSVGAEPIWVTNQLQNVNGRSGNIMWVGGGAPIKWVKPSRYLPFDAGMGDRIKVDTLVKWFTDKYPINLGLMYFNQPDADGHEFGPDSPQVTSRIAQLDNTVGYLLDKLKAAGLMEDRNIILTSDHGFSSTPQSKAINLDDIIDPDTYTITGMTPIAHVWPHDGKSDEIFQNLTQAATQSGNFTVYRKEEIPAHFHYTHNRRIPPILVVAKDHFSFVDDKEPITLHGNHGYDNRNQDMHPFFLAMGPSFKKGYSVDTFDSVDVYPMMCHLLGVVPAPNNGSMKIVQTLLTEAPSHPLVTFVTYIVGGTIVAAVASVFAFGACRYRRYIQSSRRYDYSSLGQSITDLGLSGQQRRGQTSARSLLMETETQ